MCDKKLPNIQMTTNQSLPPSLPSHWPNSSLKELENAPDRVVQLGTPQTYSFCGNFVKTSKYNMFNFLPKFLFEEFNPFSKLANCYFLIISCLQCVPVISITGGYPTTLVNYIIYTFFQNTIFPINILIKM